MSIKLTGSTSGSIEVDVPAAVSGGDISLTLPNGVGSAEQFLKNSGTAGVLEYSSMVETSTGVGIGTSSPAAKAHISNTYTAPTGGFDGNIFLAVTNNSSSSNAAGIALSAGATGAAFIHFGDTDDPNVASVVYDNDDNSMRFATNASERMRICSTTSNSDILYLNTTARTGNAPNSVGGRIWQTNGNCKVRVNDGVAVFQFYSSSGGTTNSVGTIVPNASSTSYNTSSDYRLKENVVALDGAIDRVKQLLPKRFNFIIDADTTVDGFLAHEAQTVVPEAVTGTHNEVDDDGNAVMQGIDQSKLVPLLTAALQEAIAKIETLETKVAALEAA